ncbi:MAG: methyltransferase [Bacteroidia bacterium]|jgi:tRNA1Val (adenine37-N6)-methyltransferase|nr:methyltransferase [Bacteroidia bacterium]
MPGTSFAFKQFIIKQDKCAMKVGTDAVLLGAWVIPNGSKQILDIGTGTGVVALMLAQKTEAHIDAIDIDENAFIQAKQNVSESKFANQVSVIHSSLQDYSKITSNKYNLIVTNPPYFEQSLKSSDEQRSFARHADVLPFEELIEGVTKLLDQKGKFCLILPTLEAEKFRAMAQKKGLFLSKLLRVKSKVNKDTDKRHLMQFEFTPTEFSEQTIAIELDERHHYTDEYKEMTKDYYLNF